jgi:hypothetical protein
VNGFGPPLPPELAAAAGRMIGVALRGDVRPQDIAAVAEVLVALQRLSGLESEVDQLRAELAEHVRLRTLGGPPPAVDPNWANRRIEPPASASDPNAPRLRRV